MRTACVCAFVVPGGLGYPGVGYTPDTLLPSGYLTPLDTLPPGYPYGYPTPWIPLWIPYHSLYTLPPDTLAPWIPSSAPKGHETRDTLSPQYPTPQKEPGTSDTLYPPVNRMTHVCENITFSQLRWGQ